MVVNLIVVAPGIKRQVKIAKVNCFVTGKSMRNVVIGAVKEFVHSVIRLIDVKLSAIIIKNYSGQENYFGVRISLIINSISVFKCAVTASYLASLSAFDNPFVVADEFNKTSFG